MQCTAQCFFGEMSMAFVGRAARTTSELDLERVLARPEDLGLGTHLRPPRLRVARPV